MERFMSPMVLVVPVFLTLFVGGIAVAASSGGPPPLREQVSLNGEWDRGGPVPRYDSQNSAFDQQTYERRVTVPAEWGDRVIRIEFNAVNYHCEVFVDDQSVGAHTGAWVPFSFDITDRVTPGQTFTLRLEVRGQAVAPTVVDGRVAWWIGFNEINKQRSGIVDDVWLRAYGRVHIEDAFIVTSVRRREMGVRYTVVNASDRPWSGRIVADVREVDSSRQAHTLASPRITLPAGQSRVVDVTTGWRDPRLWWPDDPVLYLLESRLESASREDDREMRRFGFREFRVAGTEYRLNGVRVNLRNEFICFSQYLGPITSEDRLRRWYREMKEGFHINAVRWHKHPAPKFAYDLADEMGMMLIAETAFYGRGYYNPDRIHGGHDAFIDRTLTLIPPFVRQFRNHPSVVLWSASNEVTFRAHGNFSPEHVARIGQAILDLDGTRPVTYSGDQSVPGEVLNRHYPEGYEREPSGDPYTAWQRFLDPDRPTHFGELLAIRHGNDNHWWWGVWPRGLRHLGVAGFAPRIMNTAGRFAQRAPVDVVQDLMRNALHPLLLTDMAYDRLGIAPFKDNAIPELRAGTWEQRTLVLFNDTYRGEQLTARLELRTDGELLASGQRDYRVPLGGWREVNIRFQVPARGGTTLDMAYITLKEGREQFRETRHFRVHGEGDDRRTHDRITFRP
jgi:hypothetical protein